MGFQSGNAGLVGAPRNATANDQSGIWTVTGAKLQLQNNAWPVDGDIFPVSNPELQWIMSANGGAAPTSFTNNTNADLSGDYSTSSTSLNYSGTWTTSATLSKTSYTNSSGDTRYYYPMTAGTDLRTSSNTSDNTTMNTNGGFTWWIVFIPYNSSTGWVRIWNYYGIASGSTTTSPGNTDEFDGPLLFLNRGAGKFEYRRPTWNANVGNPTTNVGVFNFGATQTCTIVIKQTPGTALSGTGTKYWLRNTNWSDGSAATADVNAFELTFTGSGGYGIRTGTDTGIPVFADSYYNSNSFQGIMESGFSNRIFSDTECEDLANHLDVKYG